MDRAMPSTPWWLLGLAVLLFFWAVGAYNRLAGHRRAVLAAMAALVPALGARRAAVLAWVGAGREDVAPILGSPAPHVDPAAEVDPPAEAELRVARAAQAVRHAAGQADAAAQAAAARPLAAGRLRGVSMAEEVFERAFDAWLGALETSPGEPPAGERPAGLAAVEFELAMARQAFNLAVEQHNRAIELPPARWLAAVAGFGALATLQAGPSLAVAPAQAVGPVVAAVGAARAG
jgi:LemA protein